MSDSRARDWFETEEELNEVLEAAEEYAEGKGEVRFVDEVTLKVKEYGGSTFMSEAQADWLKRIAARRER